MKKIILAIVLGAMLSPVFGQKKYVTVRAFNPQWSSADLYKEFILSGAVPNGFSYYYSNRKIGDILNMLSEKGFEVEQIVAMPRASENDAMALEILLSEPSTSATRIQSTTANDDEDVKEVARYNLQGIPVKESDRGVQIVVYSNYTTKTIIVE